MWKKDQISKDWQMALIVLIYKKGDKKNCDNYRGITLLGSYMKICEKIIDKK